MPGGEAGAEVVVVFEGVGNLEIDPAAIAVASVEVKSRLRNLADVTNILAGDRDFQSGMAKRVILDSCDAVVFQLNLEGFHHVCVQPQQHAGQA